MNRKNVTRTITAIAVVVLLGWSFFYFSDDTRGYKPVDTSVAITQINGDNVKSAQIDDREQQLRLILKKGNNETDGSEKVITKYPTGYAVDLFNALSAKNAKVSTVVNQGSILGELLVYVLPLLLLVGLFVMFSRMQGGARMGFGFGKSRAKQLSKDMPKTTFADVAGVDEAVEELYEIKDFLQNPSRYQALGAKIPKGVLLYGPPGTGKTLLARAVAGEAGVPFFTISGSDFVEMFVGVGASRVRDLFEQAKQNSPCIIFVDEIDAAEIYVPFSWFEPMWLENLGFAREGEGWKLTEAGETAIGGRLPVNPSGGVLSANPIGASGLIRFAEAAIQVMGKAEARQVPGARKALGHAYGGGSQYFSMWVVGCEKPKQAAA